MLNEIDNAIYEDIFDCNWENGAHVAKLTKNLGSDRLLRIESQLSDLSATVQQLKNEVRGSSMDQLHRSKRISDAENVNPASRPVVPNVVGFTVQLDNTINNLPKGSTVLFDGVWYNAGNGYDKTTGIFTCPRSGLYLFAIFVEAVNGRETATVTIKINGHYRISAVSELADNDHDSTGGNMMVEHLQAGDRVWVETHSFDNQDLYKHFTSFTGVLITSTE